MRLQTPVAYAVSPLVTRICSDLFCESMYIGVTNLFGHNSMTEVVNTLTNLNCKPGVCDCCACLCLTDAAASRADIMYGLLGMYASRK